MSADSELMRILQRRSRQIEMLQDAESEVDEETKTRNNIGNENPVQTGGEDILKIIKKFQSENVFFSNEASEENDQVPTLRPRLKSQASCGSSISVNSQLSRVSDCEKYRSSSSASDTSNKIRRQTTLRSRAQIKKRSFDSVKNNKLPSHTSFIQKSSNPSFSWTHGITEEVLKRHTKKITGDFESSSDATSTNNIEFQNDLTEPYDDDKYERIEINGNKRTNNCEPHFENVDLNLYESVVFPNSSQVHNDNKYDSFESDIEEFEVYEDVGTNKNIISALNACFNKKAGVLPVSVEVNRGDASTIASDDFGSENYERLKSGISIVPNVTECFQNVNSKFLDASRDNKIEKYRRRLKSRVNELLSTEEAYSEKLHHVVKDYMVMLKGDVPPSLALLGPEQIFSNISELDRFHSKEFLPALRRASQDLMAIGRVFRKYENDFKMYIKYSRDNKRCTQIVHDHKEFFFQKQRELGQRLDLASYLLEPVQRMPRYRLFLADLLDTWSKYEKETAEENGTSSRDSRISSESGNYYENIELGENGEEKVKEETTYDSLEAAKIIIERLLRKIDNTVAVENIKMCPINLMIRGDLLRQDEFSIIDASKKKYQMRCFLFEELLVFTTINKKMVMEEIFEFFDAIEVDELGLTPPLDEDSALPFTVWYRKRNIKPYIMDSDMHIKKIWLREIQKLLWNQAKKQKETLKRRSATRQPSESSQSSKSTVVSNSSQRKQNLSSKNSSMSSLPKTGDKYSSLRGIPGEVRRWKSTNTLTVWYIK